MKIIGRTATDRTSFGTSALLPVLLMLVMFFSCTTSKDVYSKTNGPYQQIFDGKTLDGWDFDPTYWRVEEGNLVGEVTPANLLKRNSFIIKKGFVTKDFDLTVDYRVSAGGNSGINYRSQTIDSLPYAMRGYQFDIDGKNFFTGQHYEERGRTTLAYHGQKVIVLPANDAASLTTSIRNNEWLNRTVVSSSDPDSLNRFIKNDDWNECRLLVKGTRMLHYINGVLMSDVTDNDSKNRQLSGRLGVQVHVGPPMKIEFRNFRLKAI